MERLLLLWKDDIIAVKALYRERKFRRCAALCSKVLETAQHPLLKTFLHFYQAICSESLGHIAHSYSGNKILLLEQARDFFISASETLPLPFIDHAYCTMDGPVASPVYATADILKCYSPFNQQTPASSLRRSGKKPRHDSPTILVEDCSTEDDIQLQRLSTPKFEDYSPRMPLQTLSPNVIVDRRQKSCQSLTSKISKSHTGDPTTQFSHKTRLSRSLSSQHNLSEECIPSPLFSRSVASRKEIKHELAPMAHPKSNISNPAKPTDRPLPPLPFNHNPQFVLKGKRMVLVPRRQTALATLISKYEGESPFDTDPEAESAMAPIDRTPTTERFQRISATFEAKIASEEKFKSPTRTGPMSRVPWGNDIPPIPKDPTTPCPPRRVRQLTPSSVYSSSTFSPVQLISPAGHVESFDALLAGFRTDILNHISTVSRKIEEVRSIQRAHEQEKRERFNNMHARAPADIQISPSKCRKSPVKDKRLRSFWNLQVAEAQAKNGKDEGVASEKVKERQKRIERLRAEGWKSVCKEAKGWKGAEYYRMRIRAERELDLY